MCQVRWVSCPGEGCVALETAVRNVDGVHVLEVRSQFCGADGDLEEAISHTWTLETLVHGYQLELPFP